jgi:hypothetical protein
MDVSGQAVIIVADVCARTDCDRPTPSSRATYCSGACQKATARSRARGEAVPSNVVDLPGKTAAASVVTATRAELVKADRLGTHLGQAALALAERIDKSQAVMGFAALVKELRETMAEAVKDVEQRSDTADQIRESALRLIGA